MFLELLHSLRLNDKSTIADKAATTVDVPVTSIEKNVSKEEAEVDDKKIHIHDFHSNEHIGEAISLEQALREVAHKDVKENPYRTYQICNGPCKENCMKESIWFGDSWKLQQYLRENNKGGTKEEKEITQLNANRFFGTEVGLEPTDNVDEYSVRINKPKKVF